MSRKALAFFCCLVLIAAAAVYPIPSSAAGKATSFELETLQGETMSLQDLTSGGRHLLLIFWTTWCPSCRQTVPEVDQIASDYSRDDLSVLGINAGWNDSRSRAARFKEENGLDFPIAFDKGSRVSKDYGIRGVPTLFLIDPQENILFQGYSVNMRLLQLLEQIESE
ncbi:MAG: TlpA family protein disulfide reductase [Desulfohalobiaceae bacterium]|nr:TlpA family protein disulfide reductase [Desulfohalobiaceae bacterium]